jgi:hypothetical protein
MSHSWYYIGKYCACACCILDLGRHKFLLAFVFQAYVASVVNPNTDDYRLEAIRVNDLHCRFAARRTSGRDMGIEVVFPPRFALKVWPTSTPSR